MMGTELERFCWEMNCGASVGATILFQIINLAKAMVEQQAMDASGLHSWRKV
jgi:hypothetical protein